VKTNYFHNSKVNHFYDLNNAHQYDKAANEVWDEHPYQKINLMDYVKSTFELAQIENKSYTKTIQATFEEAISNYPFTIEGIDEPLDLFEQLVIEYSDKVKDIHNVLRTRWRVALDTRNAERKSKITRSKWKKKVLVQCIPICPNCKVGFSEGLTHSKCSNKNKVPTILYYWIEGEVKYGMCNGCDEISELHNAECSKCKTFCGTVVPPIW